MRRWWRILGLAGVVAVIAAVVVFSSGQPERVRVGSKLFAENKILAHMFAAMLTDAGYKVETQIPYGNTFDVQEGIKAGKLDVYPEYTGTGLAMMGLPGDPDPGASLKAVREAFAATPMRWLEPLGFNDSYILVMEPDRAAAMGVEAIADLSKAEQTLRVGCEPEFLARPLDGYQPLMRRYGLGEKAEPVSIEERNELFRRLIAGQIDVAIAHRTDPQIETFGLTVLTDNLGFFPAYTAAPLVARGLAERAPRAEAQLTKLAGRLDVAAMRTLNRRVQLEGMDPRRVAVEYLVEQGLISREAVEQRRRLTVLVPDLENRTRPVVRGLESIHHTFTGRQVVLESPADPTRALAEHEALIGVIGAEHLFEMEAPIDPRPRQDLEAIAAVGFHTAHLLRPQQRITETPFDGIDRLGVGPERGGTRKLARALLDGYDAAGRVELASGSLGEQAQAVADGRLGGLLLAAPVGDAHVIQLLEAHPQLGLQPIRSWQSPKRQYRYPFVTGARIGAGTYPRMEQAVDSVGTQVVLAASRPTGPALGDGDPVSGLRTETVGIPRGLKEKLIEALDGREPLNPTLPGERIQQVTARRDRKPLNPSPRTSIATAALLAGAAGLLYMLLRQRPAEPRNS